MTVADRNSMKLDPRQPTKLAQSVDRTGKDVRGRIAGLAIRPLATQSDGRGTLTELYDLRWGHHPDPLVFSYLVSIRPGQVKGWIRHRLQDDRLAFIVGAIQVVLWDGREDSPTRGMLNEFTFGTVNRSLVTIPTGVWHALRNVDVADSFFVNYPTQPYNYENPDKELLPLENDVIPYRFR